jgi:thiamine pyrophosphate-dependent acetolactate synthase large subunit-like protein
MRPAGDADFAAITKAVELLANAKSPILYTGGGIINSLAPMPAQRCANLRH